MKFKIFVPSTKFILCNFCSSSFIAKSWTKTHKVPFKKYQRQNNWIKIYLIVWTVLVIENFCFEIIRMLKVATTRSEAKRKDDAWYQCECDCELFVQKKFDVRDILQVEIAILAAEYQITRKRWESLMPVTARSARPYTHVTFCHNFYGCWEMSITNRNDVFTLEMVNKVCDMTFILSFNRT